MNMTVKKVGSVRSPLAKAERRVKRLEDVISWVQNESRCIETRRFVARALREIERLEKEET